MLSTLSGDVGVPLGCSYCSCVVAKLGYVILSTLSGDMLGVPFRVFLLWTTCKQ